MPRIAWTRSQIMPLYLNLRDPALTLPPCMKTFSFAPFSPPLSRFILFLLPPETRACGGRGGRLSPPPITGGGQHSTVGERPDHDPQPNRRTDPDVISPDQDIRSKEQLIDEGRRFNLHTCRPARGGRCKYAFMERRANSRAGPCRRTRPQALTKPA